MQGTTGLARPWTGNFLSGRHLAAAIFVSAIALLTTEADAKPKKIVSNGCTAEQIQAPSASHCIDQLEQDVIDGVAYPHALFCDVTGVYCCQSDGTRTFGCKKVAAKVVVPKGTAITKPSGTLSK